MLRTSSHRDILHRDLHRDILRHNTPRDTPPRHTLSHDSTRTRMWQPIIERPTMAAGYVDRRPVMAAGYRVGRKEHCRPMMKPDPSLVRISGVGAIASDSVAQTPDGRVLSVLSFGERRARSPPTPPPTPPLRTSTSLKQFTRGKTPPPALTTATAVREGRVRPWHQGPTAHVYRGGSEGLWPIW